MRSLGAKSTRWVLWSLRSSITSSNGLRLGPHSMFITALIMRLALDFNQIFSAAGIGAGKRLPGWSSYGCSRYNSSYPHYLHSQSNFGTNETSFEFLACSGATSDQVLRTQVSKLSTEGTYDLLTLSAGGNDVGLAEVL